VVGGVHTRAVAVIAKSVGVRAGALADDLTSVIGSAGAAATPLVLCDVLDRAGANETIVQVNVADGVDVLVWRTTTALATFRAARTSPTVAAQIAGGNASLSYTQFLTWKGQLVREPPRRPDPDRPSSTASGRNVAWKFGFNASRCGSCNTRHLPPMRVCVNCHAVDQMSHERLADVQATVATYTIDHLAYSMSPPVVAVVIDYDGGGRFNCEMTDVDPAEVAIGQRVEMTFRRLITAHGIHNYFWKARPVRG
jgi:hydroxymethylglutaryl-CoA synthase